MRVLHVLEALEGGTARHLVDVVRHTAGVEHHVAVPSDRKGWVTDTAAVGAMTDAGADVHVVEMRRRPYSPRNVVAVASLRRLVGAVRPGIVHGHSSIGGAAARAVPGRRHATAYTPNGVPQQRLALAIERRLAARTDLTIAVSPSEAELLLALRLATRDRLVTIRNGIDLEAAAAPAAVDLRATLGLPPDATVVGSISRMIDQKRPADLVDLARRLRDAGTDAHVVVIGAGPLSSAVDDAAARAGVADRFHRLRHLPSAAAVLGQLDVFVLASAFEGGPYAPLEAMRAGVPVVLSDAVGNRDVVEHERSGLLVPVGDTAAMATAVARLLADAGARARFVAAASERLASLFDVRAMGAALAATYARLVDAPASGDRSSSA